MQRVTRSGNALEIASLMDGNSQKRSGKKIQEEKDKSPVLPEVGKQMFSSEVLTLRKRS